MTQPPPEQPAFGAGKQTLQGVENELKLALTFVKISSTAYSMGKLQHASDARSKAEAVRARAVAQLMESLAVEKQTAASIQSMLNELQTALAGLPSSVYPALRVRRVAT
jgi:hypothetical protein